MNILILLLNMSENNTTNKEKMAGNADENIDQLCQNYRNMDENGKKMLWEVSKKILEIWRRIRNKV